MSEELKKCLLCERDVPSLTDHHIVPKSRGGKALIAICKDCHRQLHALFDNKTLEEELNTEEAIKLNKQFRNYLKWIRRRPFGVVHKARRSRDTKKRGRRG
jgi:5-methylcytosine-specific restriction endonuclease McrA